METAGNAALLRSWSSLAFEVRTRFIMDFLANGDAVGIAFEHEPIVEAFEEGKTECAAKLLASHSNNLVAYLRRLRATPGKGVTADAFCEIQGTPKQVNKTLMHNNPTTRRRFIHTNVSRRQFLAAAAATWATANIVPRHVLGGPGQTAPGAKVNLAGVGVGGVGFGQLRACDQAGFNIVALCDVDDVYAKKAYDKWPQARRYRDYREMLQAEGDKIDAVYCGTPDHTHAVVTLAALRRKKHVCCVKPLTRTVEENRAVVAAAIQAGVCTQVTAQANTSEPACRTCELIQAGAIGPVREVHIWSNRPLWPQGMTRPPGQDVVPATLDWGLVDRPGSDAAVQERVAGKRPGAAADRRGPWQEAEPQECVSSVEFPRLVGLWHRFARRHGLPLFQHAVPCAETRARGRCAGLHHTRV